MNLEEHVNALAKIFSANGLTRLEASDGHVKIILEKSAQGGSRPIFSHSGESEQSLLKSGAENQNAGLNNTENQNAGLGNLANFGNLIEVKSPIVGVFYTAPQPEAMPFVNIGSKVKKGDVLCIIEAMKLLNEITAEHDGEIADICIKNGDIVEYGQALFKIKVFGE